MGFRPLTQDIEADDTVEPVVTDQVRGRGFRPIAASVEPATAAAAPAPVQSPQGPGILETIKSMLPDAETMRRFATNPIGAAASVLLPKPKPSVMEGYVAPEPSQELDLRRAFPDTDFSGNMTTRKAIVPRDQKRIEPLSPSVITPGSSSVLSEVPGAVVRAGAESAAGMMRQAGELTGIDSIAEFARRRAEDIRRRDEEASRRLPLPAEPGVVRSRLDRALAAFDDPQLQLEAVRQPVSMAAGIGGSIATRSPAPMLASMAAEVQPREYNRYRDQLGLEPWDALRAANLQAAAEIVPEIPVARAIISAPIGRLLRGNQSEIMEAARYVMKVAGLEMGSEGVSTTLNWLVDRAAKDPTATVGRLGDDLKNTVVQMGMQGPLTAAVGRTMRSVPGAVASIEEAVDPQRSIARAFEEAIEAGPLVPGTVDALRGGEQGRVREQDSVAEAAVRAARSAVDPDRRLAVNAVMAPRVELEPDRSGGNSPIDAYVDPMEAQARLSRTLARDESVATPKNERTVLRDDDGNEMVVGSVTADDWIKRVERNVPKAEFPEARYWYRNLHDTLTPIYGEQAPRVALAWLLSQQRASPSKGMQDVLRAMDHVRGLPVEKRAGLNAEALKSVLRGKLPKDGVGAKLMDFLDAELGLPTRTVMGRDPRGGQPAPFDVWGMRDSGVVDDAMRNKLLTRFPAAARLQIDPLNATNEAFYERGSRFYNNLAKHLNRIGYDGGNWTAREAQAVGWVAIQKALGETPEYVSDIIGKNTRRVSLGLAPGAGSAIAPDAPLLRPENAARVTAELADLAGIKVLKRAAGTGAYLTESENAIQIDALASPEAVRDYMNMLGYVFQQSMVIATRPLKSGKKGSVDIVFEDSAAGRENEFFQTFHAAVSDDGVDLAPGFQQINIDGKAGIRLLNLKGHWKQTEIEQIRTAAALAANMTDISLSDVVDSNIDLESVENDWTKQKAGEAYLGPLRDRLGLRKAQQLERIARAAQGQPAGRSPVAGEGGGDSRSGQGVQGLAVNAVRDSQEVAADDPLVAAVRAAIENASRHLDDFSVLTKNIARDVGGGTIIAKVKKFEKSLKKVVNEYNGDISRLKDLLRSTVVLNSAEEIARALNKVVRSHKIIKRRNFYAQKDVVGYRDGLTVLDLLYGPAEVQFNTPEMIEAKERAHIYYDAIVEVTQRRKAEKREFTINEQAAIIAWDRRMITIYEAAYAANLARVESGNIMSAEELQRAGESALRTGAELREVERARLARIASNFSLEIGVASKPGSKSISLPSGVSNAKTPLDVRETGTPSMSQNRSNPGSVAIGESIAEPRQLTKEQLKQLARDSEFPGALPEQHGRYFEPGGTAVPLDALRSTKPDAENKRSSVNAAKLLRAAYDGKIALRAPLSVTDNGDGTYSVRDGNGTLEALRQFGWKSVPVEIERAVSQAQGDGLVYASARGGGGYTWDILGLSTPRSMLELQRLGFSTRDELNGVSGLNRIELEALAEAIGDLVDSGIPSEVFRGVTAYVVISGEYGNRLGEAAYWPQINVMGIRADVLERVMAAPDGDAAGRLRTYLAHELGHAIDRKAGVNINSTSNFYTSENSDRLRIDLNYGPHGDLATEVLAAMEQNLNLQDFFSYPVNHLVSGNMPERVARVELFAQVSALYAANPGTVRDFLPTWYPVMEQIYGTKPGQQPTFRTAIAPPRSLSEARARVSNALQDDRAGRRLQDGQPGQRWAASAGEQNRPGSPRGPPGQRVASAVKSAPPAGGQSGQPPGAAPFGLRNAQGAGQWGVDQPGLIDNLLREWQNNQIDLKATQEAIERAGGVITERGNAYLAEELYRDRVTSRVKRFFNASAKPLLMAIRDSGLTIEEAGRFLWARHAPERNRQMAKINPGGPKNLSGLYDSPQAAMMAGQPGAPNAQDIITKLRAKAKPGALADIAAKADAITAATRAVLVNEGLEEAGTIAAWQQAYQHYVPLMRDIEGAGTGQGFVVTGPESKRAMGSQREAQAIIAALISQHEHAIIRAEKARVGRALLRLAAQHPNPSFWKVDDPPKKRSINKSTGLVEVGIDPQYKQRADVFVVKTKGPNGEVVERVITFNENNERAMKLAAAMRNIDVVQLDGVTKAVGKVTRILASLATSWNPLFWTTNFARDVQTAVVNLQSTPLRGRAPRVIANIPRAMAGIASAEFRNGQGKWAKLYREFEEQGGKMEWINLFNDLVEREKQLASEIKSSQRGKLNPLKWGEDALDIIEKTNSLIENVTRLSTFAEAREMGLSPAQAASLAKSLTVNFRRKGNRSTATGAWYMFFNASVQGTARMISGLARSPRAQAMVGGMVAFSAALELINRLMGDRDRDEDDNNPYELIPEYVKQRNMIFMLPGGSHVAIPLPYGFNVFHIAGRVMMETVLGAAGSDLVDEKRKPAELAWSFAESVIDSFLPLGTASSPGQLIAPTVLDPFVQHAENKTWYGSPMRPEPFPGQGEKPDHQLYFRSTSDTAKDITKWLNDMTGGDDIRGGAIDISPTTLTHIFGTITGGTGRFGLGMFDFTKHVVNRATGEAESDDLPWRAVPFVGKFYGEVEDRDRAAKFYRLRPQAENVLKQVRDYKKLGDADKAESLIEKEPALYAMGQEMSSQSFKKALKATRDEIKAVDTLPRGERAKVRRELAAEEATILGQALRAYNESVRENRQRTE